MAEAMQTPQPAALEVSDTGDILVAAERALALREEVRGPVILTFAGRQYRVGRRSTLDSLLKAHWLVTRPERLRADLERSVELARAQSARLLKGIPPMTTVRTDPDCPFPLLVDRILELEDPPRPFAVAHVDVRIPVWPATQKDALLRDYLLTTEPETAFRQLELAAELSAADPIPVDTLHLP